MTRRIRVSGVPADFRVPRGWPTPTDRWIRLNAFWVPPAGWTPTPDVRPAPAGWRFWAPNRLWTRTRRPNSAPLTFWSRAMWVVLLLGFSLRVAGALLDQPSLTTIAATAGASLLLACAAGYGLTHVRLTRRALRQHAMLAETERERRLTREYQRYLLDLA